MYARPAESLLTMIVLQHNCNGRAASMVAALEAAMERGADVACLQEPCVGKKHAINHLDFQDTLARICEAGYESGTSDPQRSARPPRVRGKH